MRAVNRSELYYLLFNCGVSVVRGGHMTRANMRIYQAFTGHLEPATIIHLYPFAVVTRKARGGS
jgi:hypothetical protein